MGDAGRGLAQLHGGDGLMARLVLPHLDLGEHGGGGVVVLVLGAVVGGAVRARLAQGLQHGDLGFVGRDHALHELEALMQRGLFVLRVELPFDAGKVVDPHLLVDGAQVCILLRRDPLGTGREEGQGEREDEEARQEPKHEA